MGLRAKFLWALVAALPLAGCAASSIDQAPASPSKPWVPQVLGNGEIQPGPPAPVPSQNFTLPANPAVAAAPPNPALTPGHVYELTELIDLAERKNPTTRLAWNAARDAALATGVAKSAYLPRVIVAATGLYQGSQGTDTVTVGPLSTGSTQTPGSAHGAISAVTLDWMLFDFGAREATVKAVEQASVIANIGFNAAHQQVIYDVSSSFYAFGASRARRAANAQALNDAKAVAEAARARLKQGVGGAIEVAEAESGVAQAKLLATQAEGAAQADYVNLVAATGLDPTEKIAIADLGARAPSAAMARRVDHDMEAALARRPDLLQAFAAEKAAQARLAAARAEQAPKIFLNGSANYNAGNVSTSAIFPSGLQAPIGNLSGGRYGAMALVGVAMPLYDGGVRQAMVAQAQIGVDSASARMMFTRQQALRQIALAKTTLTTSVASYEAARALVAASQTTYAAALTAYGSGMGDMTAVSLAQTRLLQARNAEADSRSAALSAAALLALSTGALGSPL